MRKSYSVLALLITVCAFASTARAADCICARVPMYQVPGGWFHYATVNNQPQCLFLYATGLIDAAQLPVQNCGAGCGTCSTLGGGASSANFFFTEPLVPYASVDSGDKFKAYLRRASGLPIVQYNNWTFTYHSTLALSRTNGSGTETFHAVVFKMERTGAFGFIGVEISNPGASTPVTPVSLTNAVNSYKDSAGTIRHDLIPGILRVKMNAQDDVAFIRLNRDSNLNVHYPPHHPSMGVALPALGGMVRSRMALDAGGGLSTSVSLSTNLDPNAGVSTCQSCNCVPTGRCGKSRRWNRRRNCW